jgi:hypothetical protein
MESISSGHSPAGRRCGARGCRANPAERNRCALQLVGLRYGRACRLENVRLAGRSRTTRREGTGSADLCEHQMRRDDATARLFPWRALEVLHGRPRTERHPNGTRNSGRQRKTAAHRRRRAAGESACFLRLFGALDGAPCGIRTHGPRIRNLAQALTSYQLMPDNARNQGFFRQNHPLRSPRARTSWTLRGHFFR